MNGEPNENAIVREYEFDNPPIQNIDTLIDNSIRGCHNKYFHTFAHICEYDLNFTNITNNESVNFTISDKSMGMYKLNKKPSVARQRGCIYNHKNKLTIKIYSNLTNINIDYRLRLSKTSPLYYHFFRKLACNHNYILTHCNDLRNTFHFACRQWYSFNNPGILI